ncbi:hypothetical protein AMR42_00330 [Limnothrix sp. PR1529]|uniref:hypothetical protein n=1 Tax=Limnothrix sp. PR1529 TaxID=1704291 RepID=UPI00081F28BC|nr:hypothetical protein [Limnothrix sp. PR1529]OCQ89466.1 hypothetical protein BCR12_18900 [Limnothrix sp. P13C2]PIB15673.1 hypothetical protein AMR42_00330 [Limnothrix sp. PR1529]
MNINQAHGLLNEIEELLYSGSLWDICWRNAVNQIRAERVDGPFTEALAKIHALGALDHDLDKFINVFIRSQIQQFHQNLYKSRRRYRVINTYFYKYSDVLVFVEESKILIAALRKKIDQIHADSCKVSKEFCTRDLPRGAGILIVDG